MIKGSNEGFTLTELLIVITIIGMLTIFVMANFQHGQKVNELRQVGNDLFQGLRQAQNYSIGGNSIWFCDHNSGESEKFKKCTADADCDGGQCILSVPVGGYGISINSQNAYRLFANTDAIIYYFAGNDSEIIYKDFFTKGIAISEFKLGDQIFNTSEYRVDIIFEPPFGYIQYYVADSVGAFDVGDEVDLSILITSQHLTKICRMITINRLSGQVSEQQSDCSL